MILFKLVQKHISVDISAERHLSKISSSYFYNLTSPNFRELIVIDQSNFHIMDIDLKFTNSRELAESHYDRSVDFISDHRF